MRCRICALIMDRQQTISAGSNVHHQHEHVMILRDMMLAAYLLRGYYQPAGPLISAHHHRHSLSTSGNNTGKVPPAVLSTLEGSPNPTPPPSATGHSGSTSTTTATPQQIVSSGGARSGGDESSDNDVIITASSCSGGGEVAPPPPVPQPLPLQHPHQVSYRYPQTYPPPPTPSTPQHMHHQSYAYNYPHTQYYPSPPASASIQYSAVGTNPQHHTHYHNQDLCYSSTANYPPAYFHHKSYTTPPPAPYHRRYIPPPPPHPAQYYSSDLYSSPVANASQQNSSQSQQSQQMVVTGSTAGSASSYQPPTAPPAPPPPSLVGVSSNPPPPPTLVDTYPPPVSIVDPYPPPPGYYTGYTAGPGAAGCYSHSPPTRSLAFIDAAYQSCPCPMQSCPKNVHTGPLTGDGKGPHIAGKQQQQPVQDSGASFHQLPLPPVALALPLEPPGALGPPSPARGSAGMPPPPSPATASTRNPNHTGEQEEEVVKQRLWDISSTESQSEVELKNKQELSGDIQLTSLEVAKDLQTKESSDFKNETTTLSVDEAIGKTDIRQSLLAISKVSNPDSLLCRAKSKKISPSSPSNVPLLMCDVDFQKKRQNSSEAAITKSDKTTIMDPKTVNNGVKSEVCSGEKEELTQNKTSEEIQNGKKPIFRNIMYRKRKLNPERNKFCEIETEIPVPKRRKFSNSSAVGSRLSVPNEETQNLNGVYATQDTVANIPLKAHLICKKSQPLSSNGYSMHNVKHTVRKRKLDDVKELAENKEPVSLPAKKKMVGIHRLQNKIYPSRVKKIASNTETLKKNVVLDSVVTKERTNSQLLVVKKTISSNDDPVCKKVIGNRTSDHKKGTKINGVFSHQKKPSLRHQGNKSQQTSISCPKTLITETSAHVESKKIRQCKKSDTSEELGRNKYKVSHMLRSHGLRESLSECDHSFSDDVELNRHRRKATNRPRRTSIGGKKEQCRRNSSVFKNEPPPSHHTLKKQAPQHQDGMRKSVLKKTLQFPKWSNGWQFEGEPFENKVFLSSDDMLVTRKCYPLMRHEEGDVICPRDCILLKSGPRKTDLPFVAKVAALWENPDDGEMMMSLLWYYRPEHTDQGRRADDMEDEIFASKHKDINSVACIEDKCYVLTFNEYCRYRKCVRRLEEGVKEPGLVVPQHSEYPRESKQPPGCVASELVFFCRRVYDFRQRRILKNPG